MNRLFQAAFLMLVPLLAVGFVRAADEKKPEEKKPAEEKPAEDKKPADGKKQTDVEAIQGTWAVAALNLEGDAQPDADKNGITLTFSAHSITAKHGDDGKDEKADYKLDPAATPKTIKVTPTEGADKGKTINGVYVLDGDSLTLAFPSGKPEDPAPADVKPGKGKMIMTLKRK